MGFQIYYHVISTQLLFTVFTLLIFLHCLITLTSNSSTLWDSRGGSQHLDFDFSSMSQLSMILTFWIEVNMSPMLKKCVYILTELNVFVKNGCYTLSNVSLTYMKMITIFLQHYKLCINKFLNNKPSLYLKKHRIEVWIHTKSCTYFTCTTWWLWS